MPAQHSFQVPLLSSSPSLSENDAPPPSQPRWHSSKTPATASLSSTGPENVSPDLIDSLVKGGYGHSGHHLPPIDYIHELHMAREHIKRLELELVKISSERDTLRDVLNYKNTDTFIDPELVSPMTSKIPMSTQASSRPTRESTQGKIKFWTAKDFDDWYDSPEAQRTTFHSGQVPYIEEEEGTIASAEKIRAIRLCMRSAWQELARAHRAPQVYGELEGSSRKFYHAFVEEAHLLFKCAQDGWKLDKLSRSTYLAWKATNLDKQGNLISKEERKRKRDSKGIGKEEEDAMPLSKQQVPVSEQYKTVAPVLLIEDKGMTIPSEAQVTHRPIPVPEREKTVKPAPSSEDDGTTTEAQLTHTQVTQRVEMRTSGGPEPVEVASESGKDDNDAEPVNPLNDLARVASALGIEIPEATQYNSPAPGSASTLLLLNQNPNSIQESTDSTESQTTINVIVEQANGSASQALGHTPAVENDDSLGVATSKQPAMTKTKKPTKMRPGPGKNGRNLCAHRWLKAFKDTTDGTLAEFNQYYVNLNDAQRTAYDKEATELVANNSWNKTTLVGKIH
ncbi:hypothetical protein JVU11DRAFT_6884 [Chiua virens]|nr:hypothetical protein JVU11DRAFT_6884 [Chiua virens]